ncbi:hypothetical protein FQN54_003327 [Arachnomyces sp. PD_36]|nr:hypothetical protein FQN54_003327 [Arachnomyces sp. PD_36]
MASADNAGSELINNEKVLAFIDKQIEICNDESPSVSHILKILKKLLVSDCSTADIVNAANEIESYRSEEFPRKFPLLVKFEKDKGMEYFLESLYSSIFDVAGALKHDDPRHDAMVQVICELHKLPPKSFKIDGEDRLLYNDEPMFHGQIFEESNVDNNDEYAARNGDADAKKLCEEWVNISSFWARCIENGPRPKTFTFVDLFLDIKDGLVKDSSFAFVTGTKRPYRLMVAAQYIMRAPRAIYEALSKSEVKGFGPEKWQEWYKRFDEIAGDKELGPELGAAVMAAWKTMKDLQPSKPDVE